MALSYYYTFGAPKTTPAAELEKFLKTVEERAQDLGFDPTFVLNGPFETDERKKFVRRITSGVLVKDSRLEGVTLLDATKVWNNNQETGECRVPPEYGVLLVITDERECETTFGFLSYPDKLTDPHGRELAVMPHRERWFFHDFVDNPDARYRAIVKLFGDAGFLDQEVDEYAPG